MTTPPRLAINGASGRMGQTLVAQLRAEQRFALCRVVVDAASERIDQPLSTPSTADTLTYAAGWERAGELDVVIDFSTPQGLGAALDYCEREGVALVTGTTGLGASLQKRVNDAGARIPILAAANFSLGVAILQRLVAQTTAMAPGWDLEIIEAHHGRKADAPSGTALALGQAAADARGIDLESAAVHDRHGQPGARVAGSIGFSAIRAGDIVGEHTALFATAGERIELTHRATHRAIFACGALACAAWLAGRDAGCYAITDMLDERQRRI